LLNIFRSTSPGTYQFAPSVFSVDRDCADFRTQGEAQAFFNAAGPGAHTGSIAMVMAERAS
jgi:hypothetical protein